jgi:hypothetical protein
MLIGCSQPALTHLQAVVSEIPIPRRHTARLINPVSSVARLPGVTFDFMPPILAIIRAACADEFPASTNNLYNQLVDKWLRLTEKKETNREASASRVQKISSK